MGLRPGTSPTSYIQAVNGRLAAISPFAAMQPSTGQFYAIASALIGLLALMVAIAAGLGVLNTVLMTTRDRVHDLGAFKALGMRPGQIVTMVICWIAVPAIIAAAIRGTRRRRAQHRDPARHGRRFPHRHPGQLHPGVRPGRTGAALPGRAGYRGYRGAAPGHLGRPRAPRHGAARRMTAHDTGARAAEPGGFTRLEGRTVEPVTGEQETAGRGTGGAPLRVVLGEDSVLLLAGLVKLLESAGFDVVATAGDGSALVEAVEREQPDLVIADVRMPPTHTDEGIRAALAIRGRWPGIAILVLSQYVEERYARTCSPRTPAASATCSRTG